MFLCQWDKRGPNICFNFTGAAAAQGAALNIAATTSNTATIGIIVAVAVSALNLIMFSALAIRYLRNRRRGSEAEEESGPTTAANNGFRSNTGTVRSFGSLASKFSIPEGDDLSTVSSVS